MCCIARSHGIGSYGDDVSRRIIGPLKDPLSGAVLLDTRFSVASDAPFADAGATYPRQFLVVTTDAVGQFDLLLGTPTSGTHPYTFNLLSSDYSVTLNIASGPDTTLHALIAASPAAVNPDPVGLAGSNLDGGVPNSIYGGILLLIDGGGA